MTAHADEQRPVSLQLTPGSDRFDPNDVRWARQVDGLWRALAEQAGVVQRSIVQVPGKKGGVDVIILALGSAGAISAAVEVIRMWLGRDRSRSVEITTVDDVQGRRTVTVRGESIDNETIREAVRALGGQGDA
jgi:hypothetical protein